MSSHQQTDSHKSNDDEINAITSISTTSAISLSKDGFQPHEICDDMPSSDARVKLAKLQENVRTTFAWATEMISDQVRRKHESKELLPSDKHAESVYRAKVANFAFNQRATWLVRAASFDNTSPVEVSRSNFSADLLLAGLGPNPPESVGALSFAQHTRDTILSAGIGSELAAHYWVSVVFFKYDTATRDIHTVLKVFDIGLKAATYQTIETTNSFFGRKETIIETIRVERNSSMVQYDFDNTVFEGLKSEIEKSIGRVPT